MSVDSELWSTEVMLGIDLCRLREWWLAPIQDGYSLDSICENQQAGRIVTQGLQQILLLRNHRFAGNIVREHLQFAAHLPDDPYSEPTFVLPFWMIFLRQAAQTVHHWIAMYDQMPAALHAEFVTEAWYPGIAFIAAGFPNAAVETWTRIAAELKESHKRQAEAFRSAEQSLASACALAKELGIKQPDLPEPLMAEACESAVQSWRTSVLRETLEVLFWQAQKPGLERTTLVQGAGKKRRSRLHGLLRSCDKHVTPDLLDHESLAEEAFARVRDCSPPAFTTCEQPECGWSLEPPPAGRKIRRRTKRK
jgi:hypothetical protein